MTSTDFDTIAARMAFARSAYRLITPSQAQAARILGISKSTLQRYESGSNSPTAEVLQAMVTHYGCDPGWLLLGIGLRPETQAERWIREIAKDDPDDEIEQL